MYYYYIIEIKNRILIAIVSWLLLIMITYYYKSTLIYLFIKPSYSTGMVNNKNIYFIYTNVSELFYTYINMIINTTIPIFFSIIIYQLILFIKPGLYKYEYRNIITYCKLLISLLVLNLNIFYLIILPISVNFFINFQELINNSQPIKFFFESKLNEYINFVSNTILFCILISIIISIILYYIMLKSKTYKDYINKNRKKIYFIVWLIVTVITPPDVFSQIVLGISIILIFEVYIVLIIFRHNLNFFLR